MPHDLQRLDHDAAPPTDFGRTCFADEAAIDFPSVRPVVERMRDAFLGDAGRQRLEALVEISAAEAARGREVVVTVPIRSTCRACGGRGEVWGDPCEACRGEGDSVAPREVAVTVPPGVVHGSRVRLTVNARHSPSTYVVLRIGIR
jgi:hypothetical protein